MKNNFIALVIALVVIGGVVAGMGFKEYKFATQEPKNISDMSLEDFKSGQRIEAELAFAYDYYAEYETYNTFMGIKTTKAETTDYYFLVPMLYGDDEGVYIDYFITFIVPKNQYDDFMKMANNFWTDIENGFTKKFTGKVVDMPKDVKGFLKEYLASDYDPDNDPGVSEYEFLKEYFFKDVSSDADIDARCVNYCIDYHAGMSKDTTLIMIAAGGAVALLGVALIVVYIIKKKRASSEDSFI